MATRNDGDTPPTGWSTEYHIKRWKRGDQDSFDALYYHFAQLLAMRVKGHRVWPVLKTRHEVNDLVQAVWARVVKDVPKSFAPCGPGSFLGFLGTLVDNTLIDQARRDTAVKRGDGAHDKDLDIVVMGEVDVPPAVETPTSHARYMETEELISQQLTERELQAWKLIERQGYTDEEAGLGMDCSGAAARGLYFRARRKLARALSDGEDS